MKKKNYYNYKVKML